MSLSEVMAIQVLCHFSGYHTFKDFHTGYVRKHLRGYFPDFVSHNQMVELKRESFMPIAVYLKCCGLANCTGISFTDSTPLRVCDKKRINLHKVFKNMAKRWQCSLGWFHGFKLHIITNDQGGIMDLVITKGNMYDRKPLRFRAFVKKLFGKLFGDKGYISKDLFAELFSNGVHFGHKAAKEHENKTGDPNGRCLPLKETGNHRDHLRPAQKYMSGRTLKAQSVANYFNNIFAALIAYRKPSLKKNFVDTKQLYWAI